MAERTGTRAFVLHGHDATTLHHDLRLEVDDVMFSFAAPKGPATDPSVQRLVVRTADHELDVADFQGLIPENEYGSGPIMIWDRGTDRNLRARKDHLGMPASLDDGLLEVFLEGERPRRGWALKHTDEERWLLVKMKDEYADPDGCLEEDTSIVSGRALEAIRAEGEAEDDGNG